MNLKKYINYSLSTLSFCAIFTPEAEAKSNGRKGTDASEMIYMTKNASRSENFIRELLNDLDSKIFLNEKESVRALLDLIPEDLIIPSHIFDTYSMIGGDRDNEILDLLLAHCRSEVFEDEKYSYECLSPFILFNDFESIQKLAQKGANLNAKGGEFGEPLLFSVTSPNIISFFRENNTDMNAKNSDERTALFMWPYRGLYETTISFLQNGLDPTIQDIEGNTFLHYNTDARRMYYVATNISREVLYQLLLIRNKEGNTLLHCAISNQADEQVKYQLVKYLLTIYSFMNIDINIKNNENKTPMELAQGTPMEDLFLSAPEQ